MSVLLLTEKPVPSSAVVALVTLVSSVTVMPSVLPALSVILMSDEVSTSFVNVKVVFAESKVILDASSKPAFKPVTVYSVPAVADLQVIFGLTAVLSSAK